MIGLARQKRRIAPTVQAVHLPAPVGGLNTIAPGTEMPKGDCNLLFNLVAAELGLRSRLGYREWVTGLTGSADNRVHTVIPFTGSAANGGNDRLFASTDTAIWDVSASTQAPAQSIAFPGATAQSGRGVSCVMVTPAGHFCLYADEEFGYFVYTESTGAWAQITQGYVAWVAGATYAPGDKRSNGVNAYVCTGGGVAAGSGGPTGTGVGIVDGGVTWSFLAVNGQIVGVDPSTFSFVTVWKGRVWFVQRDTQNAYFLDVNSVYGTPSKFSLGMQFRNGGTLAGLWGWSIDGGSGIDDRLVMVSTGGDVAIYQGTDPTTAASFGIVATWFIGGVPSGRRIASSSGGDVLLLTTLGVLPLSKLVIGNWVFDRSQYATEKIGNLFNTLVQPAKALPGWSLRLHPTDNTLLVTVPTTNGQPTVQLAMSMATRGWSQYRDLPIYSSEVWGGQLYFGTIDGRVCVNFDYVDNVKLADSSSFAPVKWSLLSSYQNLDSPRMKRVQMIRPTILSQGDPPTYSAEARFDFDQTEALAVAAGAAGPDAWDSGKWDAATWGGDYSAQHNASGASGLGVNVAIAMAGNASTRTTIVGFDVMFDTGGLL